MEIISTFRKAKSASTPFVVIKSANPAATLQKLTKVYTDAKEFGKEDLAEIKKIQASYKAPIVAWDCVNGLVGVNSDGQAVASRAGLGSDATLLDVLRGALQLPGGQTNGGGKITVGGTILCLFNLQMFLDSQESALIIQAIANLRDEFKANQRTLVPLGVDIKLPPELAQDFLVLDEPLPDDAELTTLVTETHALFGIKPEKETVVRAVDALRGLARFPAEQAAVESFTEKGLDMPSLWLRKYSRIDEVPGLCVERGTESFDSIGGLEQIKKFAKLIKGSKLLPRVVVRVEEVEKSMSGTNNPIDGASGDALQVILTEMEDRKYKGLVSVGHSGTGKSLVAKALANSLGVMALRFDPGAAKGKGLVGQAEREIRNVFKTINAIAGDGGAFFIASSNGLGAMKPEFLARFSYGIWMFDMPAEGAELDGVWDVNLRQFGLDPKAKRPTDVAFTGRDIRNMCDLAANFDISLDEALEYINPLSVSNPDAITNLQASADRKYLSASYPGVYKKPVKQVGPSRMVGLGG